MGSMGMDMDIKRQEDKHNRLTYDKCIKKSGIYQSLRINLFLILWNRWETGSVT